MIYIFLLIKILFCVVSTIPTSYTSASISNSYSSQCNLFLIIYYNFISKEKNEKLNGNIITNIMILF